MEKPYIVVVSSDQMGVGEKEIGVQLMKAFVHKLTEQEELPEKVLLYNMGAHLGIEGSDCLEDLQFLAEKGTWIGTCGTCANYYEIEDKIAVGEVTNMGQILKDMASYDRVVQP